MEENADMEQCEKCDRIESRQSQTFSDVCVRDVLVIGVCGLSGRECMPFGQRDGTCPYSLPFLLLQSRRSGLYCAHAQVQQTVSVIGRKSVHHVFYNDNELLAYTCIHIYGIQLTLLSRRSYPVLAVPCCCLPLGSF